ncbi:hypothetical protein [Sphingomonas ursincola]|uniref:hypothetical protein n=1 Tax=Sphingomonas ursincola TaxID=56361 RepID=UPI0023533539|nr:hypothetical protein [Sphingomonas ursincola]MBY0619981.1 hypothetical protein [Sphingomonas ursincola]
MRLVKQFDEDGCGLACTAMAAGTTYRKVRAFAFPDGEVTGTSTRRLREIMEAHGVTLGDRLIPMRGKHPKDMELGFDALLKINVRQNGREWHWVLWDHQRQKVLDPKRPPYERLRFVSYVRLMRSDRTSF